MVELRPFKASDMRRIKARESYPGDDTARAFEARGPGFTGWVDGEPVGASGVALLWRGVGEAWGYFSPWVESHPLWFHRTVKHVLEDAIRFMRLRRVQAFVRADRPKYISWHFALGFRPEAVLEKYGPEGTDFVLFARIM